MKQITLLAGRGVEGDAHSGTTVQHLSRIAKNPEQPNLRQVHLIHQELLTELKTSGFDIVPGDMGENILTSSIDLLSLPLGAELTIGSHAKIQITGLRNPCHQLDKFSKGLMHAVLGRDQNGNLVRNAGVMAVVTHGGAISVGDKIAVRLPRKPHLSLAVV